MQNLMKTLQNIDFISPELGKVWIFFIACDSWFVIDKNWLKAFLGPRLLRSSRSKIELWWCSNLLLHFIFDKIVKYLTKVSNRYDSVLSFQKHVESSSIVNLKLSKIDWDIWFCDIIDACRINFKSIWAIFSDWFGIDLQSISYW